MSTSTNNVMKNALERLEDTLTSPVLRQNSYQDLQNAINTAESIDNETVKRLLAVCIYDLNEDIKYAANAATIIGALLVKMKEGQCPTTCSPTLEASAVSVINLLNTIASANQFDALKGILFNTLLSYTDSILICVVTESSDNVIGLLKRYIDAGNRFAPVTFLTTLLKILPPANKITFVKESLALLFSTVIPLVMGCIQTELHVTSSVELLELLTEVLVDIEYTENLQWKVLIECIYNPKKYPAIMQSLLENNSEIWHRLWIVFIKLLKEQITKVSNSSGSPINSMLPVVEAAFKMDPVNRCRAFQCWSVLIDNFSRESNEAYMNKRLKLLLIPLKSSNAKVEETAISKFKTWWHLIRRFHSKMEGLTDMILMPFIHFCFGKMAAKSALPPGQFSDTLKELSLQALVEIFGHVDCEGCVNIPKLKSRLIRTKVLVDRWNEWIFCFKVAVTAVLESNSEQMIQQISCIWKSFVMTVGELPENNIRKDLFDELLALISLFVQGCQNNTKLADIVMNILIKSLFEDDNKINSLLVTKETGPMYKILSMLCSPFVEEFYKSKTVDELLSFFKPITTFILDDVLCCPNRITTWFLKVLPANDNTLVLWMALVEAVCESKHDLAEATLVSVLSYPTEKLNKYSYERSLVAAYKWFTTYSILGSKLGNMSFDKEWIENILKQTKQDSSPVKIFMLHVSLAILKQMLLRKTDEGCAYVTQIFLDTLSSANTYSYISIEKVFPALIDTLILIGSKLKDKINIPFAKTFISAFKLTVKLLLQQPINDTTIIFLEKNLHSLLDILKVKEYQDLVLIINDEILACSSIAKNHAPKIQPSLSILTSYLLDKKSSELYEQNKDDTVIDNNEIVKKGNINNAKEGFNTPNVSYCKKSSKRAASIVNTVVENGEEYVVVKSNWKFNPRKLTEHQKEMLKRKREDIPALYQDLSQSQDEFKSRAWKSDSQDTSTTSSKSASVSNNEDVSTVLNQIPNTDIVPRIFENIMADSARNNVDNKSSGDSIIVNNNTSNLTTSAKDTKSPRMALKDRVFRNVRNLVEKTSLSQDVTTSLLTEDMNKSSNENAAKTPTNKEKISTNIVSSAPPKIVSERPTRLIKKPKKFDDSEIISLRKRRKSQDARTDASDINNLKEREKSQNLPIEESEKSCFKTMQETKASKSDAPGISFKNSQQSQNSQSDVAKNMDLKTNQQCGVNAIKINNLKKMQQSKDSRAVDPEIINVKDSQQIQESRSDVCEITDSSCDTLKIDILKKSQKSQDSQSVIAELITLENSQQLQESQPDASKIDRLRNRRKSQDSLSDGSNISNFSNSQDSQVVDPEIISLKNNQQIQKSPSDAGEINNLRRTPTISNLRKRRQSLDLQFVIPEIITLANSQHLQESPPGSSKMCRLRNRRKSQDSRPDGHCLKKLDSQLINLNESQSESTDVLPPNKDIKQKEIVAQIDIPFEKDFSDKNNEIFGFSSTDKQDTQNVVILADSLLKDQSVNRVPFQDIYLDSQPKKQDSSCVPLQDTLPEPNVQTTNKIPLQDISTDSQSKEPSFRIEQNKEKQITSDNNGKKVTPILKSSEKDKEEKSVKKKGSRIVRQLLIDMVEGHPLLQAQPDSEGSTPKRATRKSLVQTTNNKNRRQALSEKLEKFKLDLQIEPLPKSATKTTKKLKDKDSLSPKESVTMLSESQEKQLEMTSFSSNDQPMSEDVIESSQDSTITTISVKSSKSISKKQPVLILDKTDVLKNSDMVTTSQGEFNDEIIYLSDTQSSDQENKDDSQFPKNVTVEKSELDLTENMDTQPVTDRESYGDVIFVTNEPEPIVINTENTLRELNTQELAVADTEPIDVTVEMTKTRQIKKSEISIETDFVPTNTQNDTTKTVSETLESLDPVEQNYSPLKDEPERKQDFLNNTQEISPIKTLSPLREKRSPSPETGTGSSGYVVIKLTSPVHSNGEPYEKCDSPEIFTEDKISPDKRNESPPRVEVIVNNTSPSSSLSLKKNRPQRRAGGRAAQMLDLCAIMNNDDSADSIDNKRSTPVNTPAKRNLKSMYNSSGVDARENTDVESRSAEQFLEFKKALPTASSSPAGPILKRKFTEITDETTSSPANKKKRVSFHDPPVSTTVAVQKYIEPDAIRSPQHSTIKRRDKTIRSHTAMKSPKRLETVFKLDNVLSKAVESFTENGVVASFEDTEMSSIDQTPTPALEVVKSSDLNDTDPICPALFDCDDPIENIAAKLSSPAMKSLFIKEIEGKVGTIADLAKMTELEINRLCIKAPKVQVARKVLLEYAFEKVIHVVPKLDNQDDLSLTTQKRPEIEHIDAEIQTSEAESSDSGMQTDATPVAFIHTQTDCVQVAHTSAQSDESGYTSTKDLIAQNLSERPDYLEELSKQLELHQIADLCSHYETKALITFCTQLFQKINDRLA